jgi:hypothetical protein
MLLRRETDETFIIHSEEPKAKLLKMREVLHQLSRVPTQPFQV